MTTSDLPGAVERLRTELDARSFAPADVVPVLSYMTVGDLRTILEALDAKPADLLPTGAVEEIAANRSDHLHRFVSRRVNAAEGNFTDAELVRWERDANHAWASTYPVLASLLPAVSE